MQKRFIRLLLVVMLMSSLSFDSASVNSMVAAQANNATGPTTKPIGKQKLVQFSCLPDDIKLDDVVSYGMNGKKNVTVADKLKAIKAYCRKGKLIGRDKREIRFFRMECWGNPPPDYQERVSEQNEKLEKLKKRYTVIVLGCNPFTP
jgi:hypothetical protein